MLENVESVLMVTAILIIVTAIGATADQPRLQEEGQELGAFYMAKTVCDGKGGFEWNWIRRPESFSDCFALHEHDHIVWLRAFAPNSCRDRQRGSNPTLNKEERTFTECHAFRSSMACLMQKKAADRSSASEAAFLSQNIFFHQQAISGYCKNIMFLAAK